MQGEEVDRGLGAENEGCSSRRLARTAVALGEYRTAESEEVVDAGERVEVTAVDGLPLRLRRARAGTR